MNRVSESARPRALTWGLTVVCALMTVGINMVPVTSQGQHIAGGLVGIVLLTVCFAVSETSVAHIKIGGSALTLSVNESLLIIGVVHCVPRLLALSIAIGSGLTLWLYRRQSLIKLAFNVAQASLAVELARRVFAGLHGGMGSTSPRTWLAAYFAAIVFVLSNSLLVGLVIAINSGHVDYRPMLVGLKFGLAGGIATASIGIAASILIDVAPIATGFLMPPLIGIYLAMQVAGRARQRDDQLAFLERASDSVRTADATTSSLRQLLLRASNDLQIHYIELELNHGATIESIVVGAHDRISRLSSPDLLAVVPSTPVLRDLESLGSDDLGSAILKRELGGAIVVPIRVGDSEAAGALLLGLQIGSVFTLGQDEVQIAQTLGAHIGLVVERQEIERSIGEMRESEQRLVEELERDVLTGLLNRAAFGTKVRERLLTAAHGGSPGIAMVLLDLDDFKRVNDVVGHAGGDEYLVIIADRIQESLRAYDYAARLGGDEFALLLGETRNADEARAIMKRLLETIAVPLKIGADTMSPGASVGVALARPGDSFESLTQRADMAMYRAKAGGKGRLSLIDVAAEPRDERSDLLRKDLEALANQNALDRFRTLFQPVVRFSTREIESYECLLRWDHATLGLISPAEFLHLVNSAELTRSLDELIVRNAIAATKQCGLPVSFNVSTAQLGDDRIQRLVSLMAPDIPLGAIRVEVSTRDLRRSLALTIAKLQALAELGIGIVIDDLDLELVPFGVIAQVKPLQVKLDRTQQERLANPRVRAVARALVRSGDELGFDVVVKGIETAADEDFAAQADCVLAQGYRYARPMELDDMRLSRNV